MEFLATAHLRPAVTLRFQIALMVVDGRSDREIAASLKVRRPTVKNWRVRYTRGGAAALLDRHRPGRPRVDRGQVIAETLRPPPPESGIRAWSSRKLAAHLGIGDATVARAWREYGLRPQGQSFLFTTEPEFSATRVDIVAIYLSRAVRAVVLRADPEGRVAGMWGPQAYRRDLKDLVTDVMQDHPDSSLRVILHRAAAADTDTDTTALPPAVATHKVPHSERWLNLVEVWSRLAGLHTETDGQFPSRLRACLADLNALDSGMVWTVGPPASC